MSINSRSKGRLGEYLVRNYFRAQGWVSDRVPGSGAYNYTTKNTNLKGDVTISRDNYEFKAEVKFKKDEYKLIYADLMRNNKQVSIRIGEDLITLSYDFDDLCLVNGGSGTFLNVGQPSRTHRKLVNMKKLLKGADFLVIKINHKPLLFIRYW